MSLDPTTSTAPPAACGFSEISLTTLDGLPSAVIDALPFGVVGLDAEGSVAVYNATEARMAGIDTSLIIGVHFFSEIGQCMNNFMVAQRFEDEDEIDAELDYILTLRMRPTPVRLRLLKSVTIERRYILIRR